MKAKEYAEAAREQLEAGRRVAAASLAVHAGINAADAVCGARLGRRAAGASHDQAFAVLRDAGADGRAVERELRRLLPIKSRAEYEPEGLSASAAAQAVERAERCVAVARRVVASLAGE